MEPKFPEIEVQLSDEDGNAFSIIGRIRKAMRNGGVPDEDVQAFQDEATSGDYDHVLQTAFRTVTVL